MSMAMSKQECADFRHLAEAVQALREGLKAALERLEALEQVKSGKARKA